MGDSGVMVDSLRRELVERHGVRLGSVRLARVPYRICPLGAHVDHQLGSSTAMAIDRGLTLAYAPSQGPEVRLSSRDFPGDVSFSMDALPVQRLDDWGDCSRGAAAVLRERYGLERGLVGVFSGRLQGGVSSSAAAGAASLLALEDVNGLRLPALENIELGRQIENDFLGLRNGILDQVAVLQSRRGHLTRIDCRTAAHESIPAPTSLRPFRILLAFSGLRTALVGTDYNLRVEECAEAARELLAAARRPGQAPVLGNVAPEEYDAHKGRLRGAPGRRAAHFFSETERVRRGVDAWMSGDLDTFGALMTASGESSIRLYECGSPPLIHLFETLVETDGVYGARFSGAGFRGCCVALVDTASAPAVASRVSAAYAASHPELAERASTFICESADGAAVGHGPARGRRDSFGDPYPLVRVP